MLNGKMYIGKTNNLKRRWNEHKWGKGNTCILNNAIKKYGIDNFFFDVVAEIPFDTVEELNSVLKILEMYYIQLFNSFNSGYNATIGGDGICFYKHTDKTKEILSQRQKEKWLDKDFRNKCATAALGYHHTDDAKRRIREALLSRDHGIYERAAAKRKGIKRDPEVIMKGAIKRRKPVLQYSIDGTFIKEYPFVRKAIDEFGGAIAQCCAGKLNTAYGYIWKYKTEDVYSLKIDPPQKFHIINKTVYQYTINNDYVAEYASITEASKQTKIGRSTIQNCLCGLSHSAGGYIWTYKNMEV